jgi:ubiquinone/menaquinone biosynthesis C-methylase UbiE
MCEWKEKRGTIKHYDRQATIYDKQYVVEQNIKIEDTLKGMKFGSNERILDLGCGTGFLFNYIDKKAGLLVGADVSVNALRVAKKRTKEMLNIALIRADADNTPFPEAIFDKVFAITVLQNMPDPTKTIIEMKRISKSKAILAMTGLKKKFTKESFMDILERMQLRIIALNTNNELKDLVAVCTKLEKNVEFI